MMKRNNVWLMAVVGVMCFAGIASADYSYSTSFSEDAFGTADNTDPDGIENWDVPNGGIYTTTFRNNASGFNNPNGVAGTGAIEMKVAGAPQSSSMHLGTQGMTGIDGTKDVEIIGSFAPDSTTDMPLILRIAGLVDNTLWYNSVGVVGMWYGGGHDGDIVYYTNDGSVIVDTNLPTSGYITIRMVMRDSNSDGTFDEYDAYYKTASSSEVLLAEHIPAMKIGGVAASVISYDVQFQSYLGDGVFDDISVTEIPEPATIGLLGVGGLLALVRRCRK